MRSNRTKTASERWKNEVRFLNTFQETTKPAINARVIGLQTLMSHNQDSMSKAYRLSNEAFEDGEVDIHEEREVSYSELHEANIAIRDEIFVLNDEIESRRIRLENAITERNLLISAISILKEELYKVHIEKASSTDEMPANN